MTLFILYAIPLGLLIGKLAGGRLDGLGRIRFHWAPLALAALLTQVIVFDPELGLIVGGLGPAVYLASTAVVLAVVVRNVQIPGIPVVAAGAAANLAAIVANGGYMPADPGAMALAGLEATDGPTNSIVLAEPALRPLTDIFALPAWVPLANVFSVGDVLIAIGLVVVIAVAMRAGSARSVAAETAAG